MASKTFITNFDAVCPKPGKNNHASGEWVSLSRVDLIVICRRILVQFSDEIL